MDFIDFPACQCSTPEPLTRGSQQSVVTCFRNLTYVMRGPTNDMNPSLLQVAFDPKQGSDSWWAFWQKVFRAIWAMPISVNRGIVRYGVFI